LTLLAAALASGHAIVHKRGSRAAALWVLVIFESLVRAKPAKARQVTLEEVDRRSLPERLRDGTARLLTPCS
jgi:hypothetical protein